ncbi:HEAT repeat domain-containing protein [Amycolatopsis sp. lyj-90]|uniref:HEAT repeat domain-containing protein n=1 Tax=Amycolatopsis sp. lyj-90 TaxID=2789285 RepID=UPI00397BAD0D
MTLEGRPHREVVEFIANDPAIRARVKAGLAAEPGHREAEARYLAEAGDLLAELVKLLPPVRELTWVGQLRHLVVPADGQAGKAKPLDYRAAVPLLLERLRQVRNYRLAHELVAVLSVAFAKKQARPVFLELFRDPPDVDADQRESVRRTLASGLADFTDQTVADEHIQLVGDPAYGSARQPLVATLAKTKDPRVPQVLVSLVDDPDVAEAAVVALGKLRPAAARPRLERALEDSNPAVQREAAKVLKKLHLPSPSSAPKAMFREAPQPSLPHRHLF